MKKIFLKEDSISSVLTNRLLPKFLFDMVKVHETSLGDNSMFPSGDEYPFDYTLLKMRYNDVCKAIEGLNLPSLDEDSLMTELSESLKLCKDMETPVRDSLEKICENAVNRLFAIPEDIINLDVKLVDKVKFKKAIRLRPESTEEIDYTFSDVSDMELSNKAVEKRRFINSLIQGASYTYSNILGLYVEDIDKINSRLLPLYDKIRIINDYLLFTKVEEMSDENPMQGSYVEVKVGIGEDTKSTIKAQGLIFPLLLQETIKGMFELFSTHGLPKDLSKATYVVKKADFVLAEPWDMRFGVGLWNMIFGSVEDTNMIPYMFMNLVKLPTEEFAASVKEILASTQKGEEIIGTLMQQAEYDNGYQQFQNRINAKNVDKSLIKDSYFTGAETNGYEVDTNAEEGDVIEEEEDSETMGQYSAEPTKPIEYYQDLVKSATLENIDFIEGDVNGTTEDLIVTINGEVIPRALILLMVQSVKIRISEYERVPMIQVHIILDEVIQRLGLAPKIYKKLIYTFGPIYSGEGRRINKEHIAKVYAKLAKDPDLYVYHDDMCYIAMLNNSMQENYKQGKTLLTEGWSKTKNTIIRRTIDILRDNLPWASEMNLRMYEADILRDYFHGAKASNPKFRPYEQLIAKILVEELGYPNNPINDDEIWELKKIFNYVYLEINNNETPDVYLRYNDATGRMEGDDFNSLCNKYRNKIKEYQEKVKENSKANGTDGGYTISAITSFEEARKYANDSCSTGPLCFTTGEGMWDEFTDNDRRTAYVCLKDGWRDIPEEHGEDTPYDDYGLSMIWVFVDGDGKLTNCCIRWNHNKEKLMKNFSYGGYNADNALSKDAIESIVGVNFDTEFTPDENKERGFKKELGELTLRLKNGESFIDIFQNAEQVGKYLWAVHYRYKVNFIDARIPDEFVHPNIWLNSFYEIRWDLNALGIVSCCGRYEGDMVYNLIDQDGNFILPNNLWADSIERVVRNHVKIEINNKINFLDRECRVILPKWAINYHHTTNGIMALLSDGTLYFVDDENKKGHPIDVKKIFDDYVNDINTDFLDYDGIEIGNKLINIGGFYTILGDDDSVITPYCFDEISKDGDNYFCCTTHEDRTYSNIVNKDGKLLFDLPYDCMPQKIYREGEYYVCYFGDDSYNSKCNIANSSGEMLLKGKYSEWPDSYSRLDFTFMGSDNCFAVYYGNNGENSINIYNADKDEFFLKTTRDKWFNYMRNYDENGFLYVEKNGKKNFININSGEFLVKEEPENWYNILSFYRGFCVIGEKNGKYNLFLDNGNFKLFDEDNLCEDLTLMQGDEGYVCIIEKQDAENGNLLTNIFDIDTKSYISDKWFDFSKRKESYIFLYSDNNEYVYDIEKKTLTNISEYRQNWLQNTKSEDIENFIDETDNYVIKVFIPNKMYRIGFMNGYNKAINVLVKNNDHYEYLFDKFYYRIPEPIGNALCLFEKSGKEGHVYNIATNQMAFTDIHEIEIDREDNLLLIKDDKGDCNIITSDCKLVFDENVGRIRDLDPIDERYVKVNFNYNTCNVFDLENNKFIADSVYANIVKSKYYDAFIIYRIDRNGKYISNILGENGKPLLNDWYDIIRSLNDEYFSVTKGNQVNTSYFNIVNPKTGEFISDNSINFGNNKVAKIVKNGKVNFLSLNLAPDKSLIFLLDEWADNASEIDSRGYTDVTYGNNTFLYKLEGEKLVDVYDEGERAIPYDFTECNGNRINLIDHQLIYKLIGYTLGRSEHTTFYRQKVTVITKDGRRLEKIYTQRGDESCKWAMYSVYEALCKELGISPASMD